MPALAVYWDLVRENRNFRRLWMAQIVSELGDWFYSLAIYSLLLELTGSAVSVGLAVVLQVLPQAFVAPAAGVVNDRVRRKRVMIAADLVRALIVLGMLLVRTRAAVPLVWVLLLVETVAATFFEPARNAVIPNIIAADGLIVANTLSSTTWSFSLAVGATLGGVTGVLLGRDAVFLLNSLSFVASAVLIRGMRFDEPHAAGAAPLAARDWFDFSPVLEGARYIARRPRLFATVLVKFGLGFLGANNVILPILGARAFPVRAGGLSGDRAAMLGMSLLMGARGAGSLLGPLVGAGWAGQHEGRLRGCILGGFLLAALGYVAVGHAPGVGAAVAAIVLAHSGTSVIWVFSTTLVQLYSEDRFRGRVFSADLGLLTLAIALSSFVAGWSVDLGVSARQFATYMGLAMLVPAGAWAMQLRRK